MMLTQFVIDDQVFTRAGTTGRATTAGRVVNLTVWSTCCPDCGMGFTQAHRARGFVPEKRALRRCPACRIGPGRRVRKSRNGPGQTALLPAKSVTQPITTGGLGDRAPPPACLDRRFPDTPRVWALADHRDPPELSVRAAARLPLARNLVFTDR
jgi:hypothetical protein